MDLVASESHEWILISDVMQFFVLAMGIVVTGLAVRFLVFFYKVQHHLAGTIRFFLFEQLVTAGGLLFFSLRSVSGVLHHGHPNQYILIDVLTRIAILAFMLKSTHNLSVSIIKILRDENGH